MHWERFGKNQISLPDFLKNRTRIFIFTGCYFVVLIYLLFFAFFRSETTTEVNLIPFKNIFSLTIYTFKSGHGIWHWVVNVPGNIIAFMPMALPLNYFVRKKIRAGFYVMLIFMIPVSAEFLQYIFQTGSCDVDDVILNVTGIFIGTVLLKRIREQE